MKNLSAAFLAFAILMTAPAQAERPGLVIINDDAGVPAPVAAPAPPVMTDDSPQLSGEVKVELQSEWGVDADDPDEERSNTFLNTEVSAELEVAEHLTIEGTALLEPVRDFDAGEDTFFEEEAVYIEEILLKYENGPLELVVGKFSPFYKNSRDQERGIWTEDFSKEYEITQKLGLGAAYKLEGADMLGTPTLSANGFFHDTSFLSETLGTNMQDSCSGDNDLSSAFLMEGHKPAGVETLYYQVGYRQIDACNTGDPDESGFLATIGNVFVFPLTEQVETDLLTEFSYVQDFEGTGNDHQYYSVSSVTTIDDKWNLSLGCTARLVAVSGGGDAQDHLCQISGGYDFGNGFKADAGWLNTHESAMTTNIIGTLVRYEFDY